MNKLLIGIFLCMPIVALQAMQPGQQVDPTVEQMLRSHIVDRQYILGRMADLHAVIDRLDSGGVECIINHLERDKASNEATLFIVLAGRFGGKTPLTRVIKKAKGSTDLQLMRAQEIIASLFMQEGASKDVPDSQGNTPAQLAKGSTALLEALSMGFLNQTLKAYKGDQPTANRRVSGFIPLLHSAITRSDSTRVRNLLGTLNQADNTRQMLSELVNFKIQGNAPLHVAVKRARAADEQQFEALKEIIQMLLGAGADPSVIDSQGRSPMALLLEAPGAFEVELIKLFVQASGRALFDAIARADTATVENVLNAMQKRGNAAYVLNNMANDASQTPLVYALSLAQATSNPARKQQLLYSAQYLVNAGATLE